MITATVFASGFTAWFAGSFFALRGLSRMLQRADSEPAAAVISS